MRWRIPLLLVSAALAGCSPAVGEPAPSEGDTGLPPRASSEGTGTAEIALVPMPRPALARCRSGSLVGPACPALIPDSRWGDRPGWAGARGSFPRPGAFELNAGAEHPGEPELDRPPRFVHVLVLGGREAARFDFRWPRALRPEGAQDGLYAESRTQALLLGRPNWRRVGELVLAPGLGEGGGIVGNHLVFRWRDATGFHAVTLHGWEPFTETVALLRAVAESVPR